MTNNILRFWQSLDSDDPLEPLFAAAPILMHSIDADGVLVKVSRFWADKLGYPPEEMLGRRSVEFLTEPSRRYASVALPTPRKPTAGSPSAPSCYRSQAFG
ncbi:MAG: PAS domain S-box protein [Pseudomonadota bacterium]